MGESAPKLLCLRLALVVSALLWSVNAQTASQGRREGKVFSLFNVVTFDNAQCTSNDVTNGDPRLGTCYTSSECVARNGFIRGTCAAGFGSCCVFEVQNTGSQINQNSTYIIEPTVDRANAGDARTVMYTINRINSNICSLRLDLATFNIQGPAGGIAGCIDVFAIQTKSTPILLCGQNSGEHIYVELGPLTSSQIEIILPATTGPVTREWDIKVSQIACGASFADTKGRRYTKMECMVENKLPLICDPPAGCLQYHTEIRGRLLTFNFNGPNGYPPNQRYSICLRQSRGYCCVRYNVCPTPVGGFTLDNTVAITESAMESMCTEDYISISGSTNTQQGPGTAVRNRYCAPVFNFQANMAASSSVFDCSPPFAVDVVSNDERFLDPATKGICLEYSQLLC